MELGNGNNGNFFDSHFFFHFFPSPSSEVFTFHEGTKSVVKRRGFLPYLLPSLSLLFLFKLDASGAEAILAALLQYRVLSGRGVLLSSKDLSVTLGKKRTLPGGKGGVEKAN